MTATAAQVTRSRQIELSSRPEGVPTKSNFKITSTELPAIAEGEFLVKNDWMSVDPYMRGRMKQGDSYVPPFALDKPLEGGCVGEVIESRQPGFEVGDTVVGNLGWREYWKSRGEGVTKVDPNLAPVQAYLGVLGMTGLTAWVGLNKIARLQAGSTLFVSAASGAVGSVACQLAKAKGC